MDDKTINMVVTSKASSTDDAQMPGMIMIFSGTEPHCRPIPLRNNALILGRDVVPDDNLMSRKHARITFEGGAWAVEDLGSTNGTYVDDERVHGKVRHQTLHLVQTGATVLLPMRSIRQFVVPVTVDQGIVLGPAMQDVYEEIRRAATGGDSLLITGESGTGKELAARAFHRAGPQSKGPFVAVNCATIPEGLAERLLFGARKGAYSGATHDTEGYVQAANGGTLFLDEISDLDLSVQAKLLRTIETQQVLELGAVAPRNVQFRICAATHDLRTRVADGRFRNDLYYRIGRPEVRLPPLRDRLEEIPWYLAECCRRVDEMNPPSMDVGFVVACLLRPWPGNVRELIGEGRRAAARALDEGRRIVKSKDIDPIAGKDIPVGAQSPPAAKPSPKRKSKVPMPDDPIADALRQENGNVSRAANRLGVHRNKVRRWLEKYGLSRASFTDDDNATDEFD